MLNFKIIIARLANISQYFKINVLVVEARMIIIKIYAVIVINSMVIHINVLAALWAIT